MREIRDRLPEIGTQEQLDRRRRDLHPYFAIEHVKRGRETAYRLVGRKPRDPALDAGISERDRAATLRHGRCAMCGRTPLEDHVKLQVDHRVPKALGGSDELSNLQPLCEECNRGKKDFFKSLSGHEAEMRMAMQYQEPHKRIGEFLKAVYPNEVRTDVLDAVAKMQSHQEDWQKRLRELRVLGWKISTRREKDPQRTWTYYELVKAQPWPDGSIRAEITRRERIRRDERAQR